MDIDIGFMELLKLFGKLVAFKVEEKRNITNEYEIVDTKYGKVRGVYRKNTYEAFGEYISFEGIPYAKPPLGELRFRAPQPPESWDNVLDCLHYKSKPLQRDFIKRIVLGSEDCLYLNIYAKTLKSEKPLPVMVWVYGGGYQIGEASRELYGPDCFMQKDVILVTFAYRLGAFGFLSLNDPDLQIPGNAGIKDQVMALKWIKQNIEYFNGDPNNITVFGESAGAASTHLMTLTPQAKGLFQKAILQSGSALCHWTNTPPRDWAYRFACNIGYKGNNNDKEVYRFLAKKDGKRLIVRDTLMLSRQERFENFLFAFTPVVEPYISEDCITNRPFKELLPNAWGNEIPMIIGGNSFEGLFHYSTVLKTPYLINDLTDCVNLLPYDIISKHTPQELSTMALKLKQAYFGNKSPGFKETLHEYMDLMSYRTFWHALHRTIKARTVYASKAPTYSYIFDFDSSFFNHYRILSCGKSMRGVSHADDIFYLFYNVVTEKLLPTTAEYKCVERMINMWYNFALNSNPNCKEIQPVYWQPIDNDTDIQKPVKVLNISEEVEFKDLPMHSKLQLWDSFYTKVSLYYDLIVETTLGPVRGHKSIGVYGDDYYSFESIPFAEVPVGPLRFRPPQPKKSWTEVRDCTLKPNKPMQKNPFNNQVEGSEDCLYVNIYVKKLNSSKPLPVIIFLFGGAFEKGDPSRDLHGPDYFMMKDVIFVTIGYRLGSLGFISFKDPQLQIPGNTGLKDQLMALKWLNENIPRFNGDTENITLFGESAGSASAHYLMCCPLAKGLFHKAILMSGNILCPWAFNPLENLAYRLAKACGYEGPAEDEKQICEYLQKQPAEELIRPYIIHKEENLNDCFFNFGPCIETFKDDMCIIEKHPEELGKNAWGHELPVLMGGTSFEGLLMFPRVHLTPFILTELEDNPQHLLPLPLKSKYSLEVQKQLGAKIKNLHFGTKKAAMENVMNYCEYASHKVFWHPILRALKQRVLAGKAPTYLYRFDFDSPDFNHQRIKYCGKQMRGVAHVDDHSYLFYGNFSWKLSPETDEYKTIQRLIDIWSSFANNANPNCGHTKEGLGENCWQPVYSVDDIKCLNIGRELDMIDLPEMEKLKVWESIYMDES
ncbi:uncharacterized protein ACRADG_000137 [Cochliomyia hominivorax]